MFHLNWNYLEYVRAPGPHWGATGPIAPRMMMGPISILEIGNDLFSVVRNITEFIVRVKDTAIALWLKTVNCDPGVSTLQQINRRRIRMEYGIPESAYRIEQNIM